MDGTSYLGGGNGGGGGGGGDLVGTTVVSTSEMEVDVECNESLLFSPENGGGGGGGGGEKGGEVAGCKSTHTFCVVNDAKVGGGGGGGGGDSAMDPFPPEDVTSDDGEA